MYFSAPREKSPFRFFKLTSILLSSFKSFRFLPHFFRLLIHPGDPTDATKVGQDLLGRERPLPETEPLGPVLCPQDGPALGLAEAPLFQQGKDVRGALGVHAHVVGVRFAQEVLVVPKE